LPDQPQSTCSQSQRHPHAFHLCFPLFPVRQPLGIFLLTGKDGGSHRWPIRSSTLGLWRSVYVPFVFRLRWHFYVMSPGDKLHCSVQVLSLLIHRHFQSGCEFHLEKGQSPPQDDKLFLFVKIKVLLDHPYDFVGKLP